MIFNSVTFLMFMVVAVSLYWSLPQRPRVWAVLVLSVTFYGFWRPEFLLVMLASAATDYFVALRLEQTSCVRRRKMLLGISLGVNLGFLLYFKYLLFLVDNARVVLRFFGYEFSAPELTIVLPLAISFYTFEAISYSVDVYRRNIPAEKSFVVYACFITFFPKLIAGPILRASELLGQFHVRIPFRAETFFYGIRRIFYGLLLKVVVADNIAPLVDSGFSQPVESLSALDVWTLAFLFGFQIYFDFSAYSHIAIGSARLLGITVPENFNFPYLANSPREFWRRWHISLSSWIRDYLYLPLLGVTVKSRAAGGLNVAMEKQQSGGRAHLGALFATWTIMGFWHGASWTFVIWGLYHTMLVAMYRVTSKQCLNISNTARWLMGWGITLPLVMLGWIPFRAETVSDALAMFGKVLTPSAYLFLGLRENTYIISAALLVFCVLAFLMHEYVQSRIDRKLSWTLASQTVLGAITVTFVFVFLRPINQFIYFQF